MKIVQIENSKRGLYGLGDDGSLWLLVSLERWPHDDTVNTYEWERVKVTPPQEDE